MADASFSKIEDDYKSLNDVTAAISTAGLSKCGLIFGLDYGNSNETQGKVVYGGKSLHSISEGTSNPYQEVIRILGETLEPFDEDGIIPAYGFGDEKSQGTEVFELKPEGKCEGFKDVLAAYNKVTPEVKLGAVTNYAPVINKAVEIVKETKEYHILVIVADGQIKDTANTKQALIDASHVALSIIMVGVGDGPWDTMEEFDDGLTERVFDNFQFVNFHPLISTSANPQTAFALNALMEIPEQYESIKTRGLVSK